MFDSRFNNSILVLTAWVRSLRRRLEMALAYQATDLSPAFDPEASKMAANLQPLIDEITATETVIDSAVALINGFQAQLTAAVTAALSNGATSDQLSPVITLGTALKSKADALAAAVTANTPAPPAPPAH